MAFLEKFGRRLGVLEYLGTWDASTNTPTLVSGVGQKNGYYVVSFSGSTNLDGITDWDPGDWAIFNGVAWEQVDNQRPSDFVSPVYQATGEPTGFVNRTDSVMSFDEGTRTLTVSPASTSFSIYIQGVKQTISATVNVQIPNTSGNYFFYIDTDGDLQYLTAFDPSLHTGKAYTAYIYWDAVNSKATTFGEERHGIAMDNATLAYLHRTRGTQLVSGASISYSIGNGSQNSDAQVAIGDAQIQDEDIIVTATNSASPSAPFEQILSPIAYIPIMHRSGSIWVKETASAYPMLTGGSRAKYNELVGGSWQLTEASANGKYLVTYIFASTDRREPIVGILGQGEYNSLEDAKSSAAWDQITFGDLPAQELKLIYVLYYQTSSGFSNAAKAAIEFVGDTRFNADRQVSATVFNGAHANLSGLLNDDHTQYFNETRGDLRYEQKNSNIQTHIASTSNPHSVTKAQVGLGSVDNVSASSLRDRSTHTGTQLASTISDFTTAVQGVNIAATQIGSGVVSNTEFETLDGINTGSTIQAQLDGKQPTGNYITALTGDVTASGPGSVTATLAASGVTAGTYDSVTVDVKGRVTAGQVNKYYSILGAQVTNTVATYTTIAGLTSATLPVGLYSFEFRGLSQSAATNTGVGFRISNVSATVSTMYGKWFISQAANGTAQSFQYDQLANNTNVTSASSIAANTNFSVTGSGVFRVTAQGTVAIQIRSETGTQVLVQPDAILEIEKIA